MASVLMECRLTHVTSLRLPALDSCFWSFAAANEATAAEGCECFRSALRKNGCVLLCLFVCSSDVGLLSYPFYFLSSYFLLVIAERLD